MDRLRHPLGRVAFASVVALASTGAALAAATPASAQNAVGSYQVRVSWAQGGDRSFDLELDNHGEGHVVGAHDATTYTRDKRSLRITITTPGSVATYQGFTTRNGINTANHQGVVTTSAGEQGTWYAIPHG